jgi:hypothetical protein
LRAFRAAAAFRRVSKMLRGCRDCFAAELHVTRIATMQQLLDGEDYDR